MESAAWRNIVSTALSMAERLHAEGSVAWYRGERDATWKLKSTLHRHDVQIVDRGIVAKVRGRQRNAPLERGGSDPGIRGLDRPPGAAALTDDFSPNRTSMFVAVERGVQGHVLCESGASGISPLIGDWP